MDWRFQILGALATMLIAVITASVPIVVRALVQFLTLKLHVDVTSAQREAIAHAVMGGVLYAEEQGSKQLRAKGIPLPAPEKMDLAKAFARNLLSKRGVTSDETTEIELEAMLEAAVNSLRRDAPPMFEEIVEAESKPSIPPTTPPRGSTSIQ